MEVKGLSKPLLPRSKPRPRPAERKSQDESEDDSECGRSSLGKAKRRMHNQGGEEGSLHIGKSKKLTTDHGDLARAAKRSSNYLDEVLAQREEKKRKKKHKKQRINDNL